MPKKGNIPWNKGIKMNEEFKNKISNSKKGSIPWNKGIDYKSNKNLIKYCRPCSEETKQKIGFSNSGNKNGMFGTKHSEEYKLNQSIKMKQLIKNGKFTPNIFNSKTHWQVEYKGKKFRSSWEAAFYAINQNLIYEYHRIEYFDDKSNKYKIYITDFTDVENKIIYEIKPSIHLKNTKLKIDSAINWCEKHFFKFSIISENWFKENLEEILNSDLDDNIKNKIKNIRYDKNNKN